MHVHITSWLLVYPTPLPPAAQAPGSGSLAGAVVGACIGTALLYTVVLLVVIFALLLWNKRHRSVLFSKAINTCGMYNMFFPPWFTDYREIQDRGAATKGTHFELVEPNFHC